eukprot:TRINITY_DN6626_c0_g2_i1.p2 TRINITY_DN6626_c0_g2~~TRINITY_DN6626_c0_g2_i1.p2  ORF type:complete len:292 (-),score=48.31 TRINITY_DN6626_c0_g2_i1:216-1091(-)
MQATNQLCLNHKNASFSKRPQFYQHNIYKFSFQKCKLKSRKVHWVVKCQEGSAEKYGPQQPMESGRSSPEQEIEQEEQAEQEQTEEKKTFRVERDDFYAESIKQAYKSSDSVFSFEDDPLKLPLTGIRLSGLPASLDDEDTLNLGRLVEEVNNSKSKRRTMLVGFSCNRCTGRSWRMVNPWAFSRGLVYVQCFYCESWHKLVDNISLVEEINFVHDDDVEETQDMIVRASAKIREELEQKFQEDVETWVEQIEKNKSEGSDEGIEVEGDEEPIIVGQFVGDQSLLDNEEKE